ncbi:hypothetical protein D9613_004022 [Agrocybe pediades]|uniref:Mitochondrial splicing suppressor 51-like C-terminal domain-containing protein n=1 Tax=Agrocybe pediades TaxID=84607 RepID=A0A8H4QK38_9AGAR|nr:hypothetical protein D9613_004022 [Agrocybe pediades]
MFANWPKHKPLCKAFKAVEATQGTHMLAPFLFLDEDEDTLVVKDIPKLNEAIERVSSLLIDGLTAELKRPLTTVEKNLIGWEPRCLACGRSDAIFRIESSLRHRPPLSTGLKPCPDCSLSFFCSPEHWAAIKEVHQDTPCQDGSGLSQCAMNKICVRDVKFAEVMAGANPSEHNWTPERVMKAYKKLPTGHHAWGEEFMPDLMLGIAGMQVLLPMIDCLLRHVSEPLSMPMTIMYGLEKLHADEEWTRKRVLHIHVIGAAEKEMMAGQVFEEILHRLPHVKRLSLTLCGPDLQQMVGYTSSAEIDMNTCQVCFEKGCRRTHDFVPKTYHEFVAEGGEDPYEEPDLAIAFNSGMSQEDTESWKETLRCLVERRVPTLLTAYNEEEAKAEAAILREALEGTDMSLHPELGPVRNPWGSLKSRTEPNKVTGFYAVNGWLAGGFGFA